MPPSLPISEIFHSIQGEGKLLGLPSVFIRVAGCNLRCHWCDTDYASWNPVGNDMTIPDILAAVEQYNCPHVVLTGGEPMIMPAIADLCSALADAQYHITLETAATVFSPVAVDLASLSPKLANSTPHHREAGRFAQAHERGRLRIDVIQQFINHSPDFQLKFVVSDQSDLTEIQAILDQLKNVRPTDVLLMPEGTDPATLASRATWIADLCKQTGHRYAPRIHVDLYGNRKGT